MLVEFKGKRNEPFAVNPEHVISVKQIRGSIGLDSTSVLIETLDGNRYYTYTSLHEVTNRLNAATGRNGYGC